MIAYTTGDVLTSSAQALINPVNCVGVMGAGLALQFRRAYPQNHRDYVLNCSLGVVVPGRMFITWQPGERYVINFPTKRHWRDASRMEDLELGLEALVRDIRVLRLSSVALPRLGCGLGGLAWSEVQPRLERALAPLEAVRIEIYTQGGLTPAVREGRGVQRPQDDPST